MEVQMKMLKKRGFVLPSTIFMIVVISVFSLMMFTFLSSVTTSNRAYVTLSEKKLSAEQIFYEFKNGLIDSDSQNLQAEIATYKTADDSEGEVRAIIAKNNGSVLLFGIYNFSTKQTLCYQTASFCYDTLETGDICYGDIIFILTSQEDL